MRWAMVLVRQYGEVSARLDLPTSSSWIGFVSTKVVPSRSCKETATLHSQTYSFVPLVLLAAPHWQAGLSNAWAPRADALWTTTSQ